MQLKNNIRVLMAQQGYKSLQEFANKNNLSYYMVRKLTNNETNSIDIQLLMDLCAAFDCGVDDLIYVEKEGA